ncbi:YgeY family selenium metabolism-linked hydrolase [Candidatus Leptofilum sp.]|uniref:YgeY family selenium metabolism-linked hydrolase n=1 Tax=Candidatus Leptofilum sp. TaxID=3241576 RepID=UPI003B58CDBB
MNKIELLSPELEAEILELAQSLIRIKSLPGQEGDVIQFAKQKMEALGYDEVILDSMGNVLGRIGNGEKSILLDAHLDTVAVNDAAEWEIPPFSGKIADGRLHGRGSVDMKSAAAAAIYAGLVAKNSGLAEGKTIYISCTVMEEDCDGENLKHLFEELNLRPDYVLICEPSNNQITLGHKGKAQIAITTHGVSAHGAAPEKGKNAIYEMAEIIQRVEKLNAQLPTRNGRKGTLVMSKISSTSASLNAVPTECEVYLDRRMVPGETKETVEQEMAQLTEGTNASWAVGTLHKTSWTGKKVRYEPFHPAWKIEQDHPLTSACVAAYRKTFGTEPQQFGFWDFSTNAVTPVSLGIPSIGFGPGDYKLAHMRDESCEISQILDACRFYIGVIHHIL